MALVIYSLLIYLEIICSEHFMLVVKLIALTQVTDEKQVPYFLGSRTCNFFRGTVMDDIYFKGM